MQMFFREEYKLSNDADKNRVFVRQTQFVDTSTSAR